MTRDGQPSSIRNLLALTHRERDRHLTGLVPTELWREYGIPPPSDPWNDTGQGMYRSTPVPGGAILHVEVWPDPGGVLRRRMDGSRPFRMPWMADTIRGRSWAIHDGVLERRWMAPQMYKFVDRDFSTRTFPDAPW